MDYCQREDRMLLGIYVTRYELSVIYYVFKPMKSQSLDTEREQTEAEQGTHKKLKLVFF
jgi:hypothetical protein